MTALGTVWNNITANFNFRVLDMIDILLIALIVYQMLKLTRQTRALEVVKGLGVLILAAWVSEFLHLETLNWLLTYIINSGVVVIVVLFQPEIRRLLENIGRGSFLKQATARISDKNEAGGSRIAEELFDAMVNMSRTRTGALIIVEQETGLDAIMASGTIVDADISSALVENIFYPNTPLHDGAVVIRNGRIAAAACILPLTARHDLSQALGTRHRACIGMSENSDAYCFVVSEERGAISMAHDGVLTENFDSAALRQQLNALFADKGQSQTLWKWLTSNHQAGGAEE